jgi:membrane-bound ClpP family serine protease
MKNARLIVAIVTSIAQAIVIIAIFQWVLPRFNIFFPLWAVILILILFATYAVTLYKVGSRTLVKKALPGLTNMVGLQGKASSSLGPKGQVKIAGELWEANAESGTISAGAKIVVVGQTGLRLTVRLAGQNIHDGSLGPVIKE